MNRTPAVAGIFYEMDKEELARQLEECFLGPLGPQEAPEAHSPSTGRIKGLICPHAGYLYSGPAAAHSYAALARDGLPQTAVIIGPNHYGSGAPIAISPHSSWSTPLGTLERDDEIAHEILRGCEFVREDERPHSREHSIEVQLPFLQYIGGGEVRIVPIAISLLSEDDAYIAVSQLGPAIAAALQGKSAVIIASTDFSHYETSSRARSLDALAMEQILRLEPQSLLRTVHDNQISMCGATGVAIMLEAARQMGANTAEQLAYYTSGDVSGDHTQVVGYGAVSVGRAL